MSEIEEAVKKAIAEEMDKQWGDAASDDPPAFDHAAIARAAIEAYEDAKMRDLLSGLLVQKVNDDGRIEHVDREAMINTWEGRKR